MSSNSLSLEEASRVNLGLARNFLEKNDLLKHVAPDHIGYKCPSPEVFNITRKIVEDSSSYFYQSYVSGRRVLVARMKIPFRLGERKFHYFELSDQKPDGSQKEGFDHLEVYPLGIDYESLIGKIVQKGIDVKTVNRPHHTTCDIVIDQTFKIRISREPLIKKIVREEILVG